jgi:RNA polymerase sigma-70 factor (ECF subfamily)
MALAPAVAEAWERARAARPALATSVAGDELFAFIGARIRGTAVDELARRHVGDLLLAFACERGDAGALAALEREVMPDVARALASFADRHEALQILRERMLVDGGIAAYDGRAPLAVWLRVCATRIALRHDDRERRASQIDERYLDSLAPGVPDPQLAYLKRLYGAQFRAAFDDAVASLAPRQRTLLRLSVLDGLGIDQIAAVYHVHRATAARQLQQARATLVEATRERMRAALDISETELESIMRMVLSVADVTLRQVLASGRATPRETP